MEFMVSGRKKVILAANYGHGKTLILKSKALQLAASLKETNTRAKVFFVSFTAAEYKVKHRGVLLFSRNENIQ